MRVIDIARRARSAIATNAVKMSRSPWMSVAAAVAVLLGTGGTYLSGNIGSAGKSCDLHRELLLASGSPDLRAYRNLSPNITEAQAYLALAMSTVSTEQRREYAFLGIAAANKAIVQAPASPKESLSLFPYPNEKELSSYSYMKTLASKIYRLDVSLFVPTVKAHDRNFGDEISKITECDKIDDASNAVGAVAVLFSLISVILIAFREFHQIRPSLDQ